MLPAQKEGFDFLEVMAGAWMNWETRSTIVLSAPKEGSDFSEGIAGACMNGATRREGGVPVNRTSAIRRVRIHHVPMGQELHQDGLRPSPLKNI